MGMKRKSAHATALDHQQRVIHVNDMISVVDGHHSVCDSITFQILIIIYI